jgi:hypothetical protein
MKVSCLGNAMPTDADVLLDEGGVLRAVEWINQLMTAIIRRSELIR